MESEMATKSRPPTGTADQWEDRSLGATEEFVAVAPAEHQSELDAAIGLRAISIRVPSELIDQYKAAAHLLGLGYQPLMRDAMQRMIHTYLSEASKELEAKLEAASKVGELELKKAA